MFDPIIHDLPTEMFPAPPPLGPDNNPKTAVLQYLEANPEFQIDKQVDRKLLISVAPDEYLERVR
jgi:cephalosporin hydroxylase